MNIVSLYKLRDKLSDIEYCNITSEKVNYLLYGDDELEEMYLSEEYDNYDGNLNYPSYVIKQINDILFTHGVVTISIRNSSGSDATLMHEFVLFLIDNRYYRMESYGKTSYIKINKKIKQICESLYTTRIVEWPTYDLDIIKLLTLDTDRLSYWNGLFSSDEKIDNDFNLDITLKYN